MGFVQFWGAHERNRVEGANRSGQILCKRQEVSVESIEEGCVWLITRLVSGAPTDFLKRKLIVGSLVLVPSLV